MKNISKYTLAAIIGSLCLTSCELDEYNPSGSGQSIENFETWKGLATYCYAPLATQLYSVYDFLSLAEGGTDMFLCPAGNPDYAKQLIYYDGLTINTNASNKVFKQAYAVIASCNSVINHASAVEGDATLKKKIVAEAKTLRAFYNLLLVTYYGPVTLTTSEVGGDITLSPTRNTIEEFYTSITTDLKEAAEDLDNEPIDGNYARVTKKTALGILARAYAQGAGEGMTEDGVSYWQRAKDVATGMISQSAAIGMYLYPTVDDLWAQDNNRGNKEALFICSGANTADADIKNYYTKNNLFTYTFCNPNKLNDLWTTSDKSNYYFGRTNNCTLAPSQYTVNVFDASWDRRWENSFLTAFGEFTVPEWGVNFADKTLTIIRALRTKYGMGSTNADGINKVIPFVKMVVQTGAYNNYVPAGVYPKGIVTEPSDDQLIQVKNVYVIDYPVAADDNRFRIVLSKEAKTAEEKKNSIYLTVNIDDLFGSEQYSTEYKTASFDDTNAYQLYPCLNKFNWCYYGSWGSGLNTKNGDVMIMRSAEIYLIAAEACQQLGDGAGAAQYLKPLRDRACRAGATVPALTNATENDIFDEYAREMAGEFNRWALLKRHKAFETRLPLYNKRAAAYFDPAKHYNRPISADFLNQINNKDQYGDNGYGTTPTKGF